MRIFAYRVSAPSCLHAPGLARDARGSLAPEQFRLSLQEEGTRTNPGGRYGLVQYRIHALRYLPQFLVVEVSLEIGGVTFSVTVLRQSRCGHAALCINAKPPTPRVLAASPPTPVARYLPGWWAQALGQGLLASLAPLAKTRLVISPLSPTHVAPSLPPPPVSPAYHVQTLCCK